MPETPSAVAVGLNGTESPSSEPSVLKGESLMGGKMVGYGWLDEIFIKNTSTLVTLFWISQNFHPNHLDKPGNSRLKAKTCRGTARPESSCTTVTPTCFWNFRGGFSKAPKKHRKLMAIDV